MVNGRYPEEMLSHHFSSEVSFSWSNCRISYTPVQASRTPQKIENWPIRKGVDGDLFCWVPPTKIDMSLWKEHFIFQTSIFRGHTSFQGVHMLQHVAGIEPNNVTQNCPDDILLWNSSTLTDRKYWSGKRQKKQKIHSQEKSGEVLPYSQSYTKHEIRQHLTYLDKNYNYSI